MNIGLPRCFFLFLFLINVTAAFAEDAAGREASVPAPSPGKQAKQIIDSFDADKDGRLNRDEYANGTVRVFQSMDHNANVMLDTSEVDDPGDPEVKKADRNGDLKLSFTEVLEHQEKAFDVKDKDDDGYLSSDEIESSIKEKSGPK